MQVAVLHEPDIDINFGDGTDKAVISKGDETLGIRQGVVTFQNFGGQSVDLSQKSKTGRMHGMTIIFHGIEKKMKKADPSR